MTYLFILESTQKPTKSTPQEVDSLREVIQELKTHSLVAWCDIQNTGAAKVDGRFIKFGWRGCSELLGQLKDGRLLAVECKRLKGGKLSNEQTHFIDMVNQIGGCAFVATNLHDVLKNLGSSND